MTSPRLISTCFFSSSLALLCLITFALATPVAADPIERIELLPPSADNPRNSEGDFIQLKDGRLLFIYTHYTDGAADNSTAYLASRTSTDGGATWTDESVEVLENHAGENIMSVSLLRLPDDSIALFYLAKNSWDDCRPVVRFSKDETKTWSDPVTIIPDSEVDYYVLNNDRVIQLESGRLLLAVAQHTKINGGFNPNGRLVCYYSDDQGQHWKRSEEVATPTPINGKPVILQEPGLIELSDGRTLMFVRTNGGTQFVTYSEDDGHSWTQLESGNLVSPVSPATIERIPQTGDLVAVWNNHANIPKELAGKRTPLTLAVSKDEGQSWTVIGNLYDDPHGWYCYTAMDVVGDHIVLGHCAGDRTKNNGLAQTNITRLPVSWITNTK
ncbi:Sialidase precursor [Polystyrenella longa]|uniref:Sialidase n=1 Tax=Polystyrenella longa TaxID=2528007 RepID=A0A518CJ72_9PLAN|nr:sialidase family protein [Polystyrenella longa]QDU79283.1 Sialidase precursor [Polystyrenella longa]